jgi:5'-3' exonuclease
MTTVAHTDNHPDSIALVDMGYLFKKRFVVMADKPVPEIARAVLGDLEHLRRGVGHVIVCRDAPPYLREGIYPDYKGNRPKAGPEEVQAKKRVFAEMQRLGFNVAWCQGFEADDVIATLAKAYGEWCPDVRIVGNDKDMAQCITDNVRQFIPPIGDKDWEVRDVAGVLRKWGVTPELMPFYQALVGDKSDNVPGVPGIGPVNAKKLVNAYPSAVKLASAMAEAASAGSVPAPWAALAAHYESGFILSLKLVTLATNVPVDLESLLVPRAAEPAPRSHNNMDVEFDGYVGNETPMTPPDAAVFDRAKQIYDAQFTSTQESANDQTTAAKDEALLEKEYDRERGEQSAADTSSNDPGDKSAERVAPPKSVAAPKAAPAPGAAPTTALAKTTNKYGMVNAELQPLDLESAYTLSRWLKNGGLFKQYQNEAQIFTVILQGRELGVGATTALANTHMIDGKPVKHADFIRALVERDASFEYLMPVEMSATSCTWEGKRKGQPRPVKYTYTMADAKAAGLCRDGNYGKPGNWEKRPQDMLNKTAASKLARLLWPGATMGLYCPEEMGYSEEELEREAA